MQSWKRITKIFALVTSIPLLIIIFVAMPLMIIVVAIAGGDGADDESLDIWTAVKNEVKYEDAIENDITGFILSQTFVFEGGNPDEGDRELIKQYIQDNMCISGEESVRFVTLQEVLERIESISYDDESYPEFVQSLKLYFQYEQLQDGRYPYPLEIFTISSMYGNRPNPTGEGTAFHHGIDLVASEPYAAISSISDGEVVTANTYESELGNYVIIKYKDRTGVFYGVYGHMSGLLVSVGDEVEEGEIIGLQGGNQDVDPNAGDSTGRHLHFEIRRFASSSSSSMDPALYILN